MIQYDPEMTKKTEVQKEIRAAVYEILMSRNISFAQASREIGLKPITLWVWYNKKRSGTYLNVCKILNWLMVQWPEDKEWPIKEIGRE